MRGLRVLHVISNLGQGGAETVMVRLITETPDVEHRVAVLSSRYVHYKAHLEELGVEVHDLDLKRRSLPLAGLVRLHRIIKSFEPDVVQTWMYHADLLGGLAAKSARAPHICWGVRTVAPGKAVPASTRLISWICSLLSSRVPSRIISCSERARDTHIALGYDRAKFDVIPNGFRLSLFKPDSALRLRVRSELGLAADEFAVGMVARWHPYKDHANLVAAMKQVWQAHPEVRLVLAGIGLDASNQALAEMIDASSGRDRTILLGRREDVPGLMNALDLHVLSSSREGFPNAVAEAMACGTPCVCTDVGDAALIVGEIGIVVPPGDPGALAEAISKAIRQSGDRQGEQASAERIARMFSMERMVSSYLDSWTRTPA